MPQGNRDSLSYSALFSFADSPPFTRPEPGDHEQVSFSCTRKCGAILSLPVPALRKDTLARGYFGQWLVKNIDLWFAFTQRLGLGITRMGDIVLVTGCHLARSWANIAFPEGRDEEQVSFGVKVSGVCNVEWRFPPEDVQGAALNLGPSGKVRFGPFQVSTDIESTLGLILTLIALESARGSVYIYSGFSCHPSSGVTTTKASRSCGPSSDSRRR